MKSYTDINQSKRLAEMLPVESALNFAELIEEDKDKMRNFFNKVKQQIQKNKKA